MAKSKAKMQKQPQQRVATSGERSWNMNVRAIEGNERRFIISFSSEDPYNRCWGVEILSHADGAVDLTRLNEIGVVLFNHDRDCVVGKIIRAWIENSRGCAEIEFDTDKDAEVIFQKVSNGTLKGVSVGYRVDTWEEVAPGAKSSDGRFDGPCDIATKWMPLEVSIVSVPADATVGVGRELEDDEERHEEVQMVSLDVYERQIELNKNMCL